MPIDFRYHITSLIAVFLALLIGVLVGIALVGDLDLEQQVQFVNERLSGQENQIEELKAQVGTYSNFSKEAVGVLTHNLLEGRRVALIYAYSRERDPFYEELPSVLKHAGAAVTSTTTILDAFRKMERADAEAVFEEFEWPVPIDGDLRADVAAKLAVHIAEGKSALPARLKEPPLKIIGVNGDYMQPADCVVMVAGLLSREAEASVTEVDLPMIRGLQEAGHRVVACQPGAVPISTIADYQVRQIPTVEAADMPYGQLALVLAIDRANGNFGAGESALWPRLDDYLEASLRPTPKPAR